MPKFNDLTNKQFGRLKVIKRIGRSNGQSKHSIWECLCSCGKTTNVVSTSLTRNLTKSCGCFLKETAGRNQIQLSDGEAAFNILYRNYKAGAKKRNLQWSLSKDQFKILTKNNCYYCNIEPKQYDTRKDLNGNYIYNGIDRLNNNLGYEPKNCYPCCGICNRMKNKYEFNFFVKHIETILNNIKGKK